MRCLILVQYHLLGFGRVDVQLVLLTDTIKRSLCVCCRIRASEHFCSFPILQVLQMNLLADVCILYVHSGLLLQVEVHQIPSDLYHIARSLLFAVWCICRICLQLHAALCQSESILSLIVGQITSCPQRHLLSI